MMDHFRQLAAVDPAPLVAAVAKHAGEFGRIAWRETTPGTPHPDSAALYLRMPREISRDSVFNALDCADLPLLAEPAFEDAALLLRSLTGAALARMMIVKLKPGGRIAAHIDEGAYAAATHRWHLAIASNDGAWLQSGPDRLTMQPGEVWWFDKHALHCGANDGASERIHLIADTFR
jgi:hypothetical protein